MKLQTSEYRIYTFTFCKFCPLYLQNDTPHIPPYCHNLMQMSGGQPEPRALLQRQALTLNTAPSHSARHRSHIWSVKYGHTSIHTHTHAQSQVFLCSANKNNHHWDCRACSALEFCLLFSFFFGGGRAFVYCPLLGQ